MHNGEIEEREDMKVPIKGDTFGELVDFLSAFPRDWKIAIYDENGVPRREMVLDKGSISTVLSSQGDEIEF